MKIQLLLRDRAASSLLIGTIGALSACSAGDDTTKVLPIASVNQHILSLAGPVHAPGEIAGSIVYVPLPEGVTVQDLDHLTSEKRTLLEVGAARFLPESTGATDLIVVHIDSAGHVIRPNASARTSAQTAVLSTDSAPTAALTNELTFTYDSPANPFTAQELTDVQSAVSEYYSAIKEVYGPPAFSNTVNISKDSSGLLGAAGVYYAYSNSITIDPANYTWDVISSFVLCHEMVHAFHDDYVMSPSVFEEGWADAVQAIVFARLHKQHPTSEESSARSDYEFTNHPGIGSTNGSFYNATGAAQNYLWSRRYKAAGMAWAKAYLDTPGFFKDSNLEYYQAMASNQNSKSFQELLDITRSHANVVENVAYDQWVAQQNIFDVNPAVGDQIVWGDFASALYLNRDATNFSETAIANTNIDQKTYDYQNALIDERTITSNDFGNISVPRYEVVGPDYTGMFKVVLSVSSPTGPITATQFTKRELTEHELYVQGVVAGYDSGTVTITDLSNPTNTFTKTVYQGAFATTEAETKDIVGRMKAVFTSSAGAVVTQYFNKLDGGYFLIMNASGTQACTPADCNDNNPCTVDACNNGVCSNLAGNAGVACRAAVDVCDQTETCSGNSTTCPADAKKVGGTLCRAASGPCDVAETCSGNSNTCPADAHAPSGTACTGGTCNAINQCIPSDGEPCKPNASFGPGVQSSGNFNTKGAYCFRTPMNISGWGCSNMEGRNLQMNDVAKTCGSMPMPTKYKGYYYFESTAGAYSWASIYWW